LSITKPKNSDKILLPQNKKVVLKSDDIFFLRELFLLDYFSKQQAIFNSIFLFYFSP
jgi:hypothetical protein